MPSICSLACLLSAAAAVACAQTGLVDPAESRKFEAHATAVTGQVTRMRDTQPWALSPGEHVPIRQVISTGRDGYARFEVAGGSNFDLFANSRVLFRQNAASAGDLLDVVAGRVRIHLQPSAGQAQQRVFTPAAIVSTIHPATIAIAIDEDRSIRIDVLEGEVSIRHTLLPRSEATIVRAIDAILVRPDQQITRRVDRGTLYRYAIRPLHDLWTAVTPGHTDKSGEPIEGNRFLARSLTVEQFQPGARPIQ